MNADTSAATDEHFTSLLIACDEALAAGAPAPVLSDAAPDDLRPRLERGVACLQLLGQYWSTRGTGTMAASAASTGTTGTWSDARPFSRFGRFHILRELGHGSFGAVYLAHDPLLERDVALKIPHLPALVTPELRQRFRHEAQAAGRLDHPNLVPVYEAGVVGEICFLASAYCPGTTLAAWLQQRQDPVPWRFAASLLATLADAVQHAHSRGVLHRDLKPANILLQKDEGGRLPHKDERGRMKDESKGENSEAHARAPFSDSSFILPPSSVIPRITDFGLAKLLVEGQPGQTGTGMILGSPCYMAPEQAQAKNKEITTAADVYGLGAILYETLTARPPFLAETTLATLQQVQTQPPVPPRRLQPHVPRDLETICLKCLDKDPRRRYGSAHGLAEDLRRLLAGEAIQARAISPGERLLKWARRRPTSAAVAGVTCLAAALLFILSAAFNIRLAEEKGETDHALQRELEANAGLTRANADLTRALYFHGISLAHHEWLANNVRRTEELLEACPPELRQWEWRYLKRLVQCGFTTLSGHDGEVSSVAFDARGKRVASGSVDRTVRVWEAETGKELCILRGHTDCVETVAFSPDGQRLASASRDKTLKVWDLAKGEVVYTLDHPGEVAGVAYSPDGRRLASGGWDKRVRIWDARSGKLERTLAEHPSRVFCVAFSPDGRRLASGSSDVRIWDTTTGELLGACTGNSVEPLIWVGGVAFHPDGTRLASANGNKTVCLWDSMTFQALHVLRGHKSGVNIVSFSPDGARLASASYDQTVRLWDTASGAGLHTLRGHTAPCVSSVAFAPDGEHLVSGGADRTVRLWDARAGQEAVDIRGGLHGSVACSADGRFIATASYYEDRPVVVIWDGPTIKPLATLRGLTEIPTTVAFRPDSRYLASAGNDKTVKVWDTETWKEEATLRGHTQPVVKVAYSPDGKQLASASLDGTVKIWDPANGEVRTLTGHEHWVNRVAFSPDGNSLASVSEDKTIRIWNAATGDSIRTWRGHAVGVTSLAFDPIRNRLITGDRDGVVNVWHVATGELAFDCKGHTRAVRDVVFSPDGQRFATGSEDYVVKLWDAEHGQEALALRGHHGSVNSVAFSPDGTRLFAGAVGMKIWEALPTGKRSGTTVYSEPVVLRPK
jgi:WD40 repeat protein/serine/threonine protein kinase